LEILALATISIYARQFWHFGISPVDIFRGFIVLVFTFTLLQSKISRDSLNDAIPTNGLQRFDIRGFQYGLLAGVSIGYVAWSMTQTQFPFEDSVTHTVAVIPIVEITLTASNTEIIGNILGWLLCGILVFRIPTIQLFSILFGQSVAFSTAVMTLEFEHPHGYIYTYPSHFFLFMSIAIIMTIARSAYSRFFRPRAVVRRA
jgi:hypothetical protein